MCYAIQCFFYVMCSYKSKIKYYFIIFNQGVYFCSRPENMRTIVKRPQYQRLFSTNNLVKYEHLTVFRVEDCVNRPPTLF